MPENKSLKEINYQFKGDLNSSSIKMFTIVVLPVGFTLFCLSAVLGKLGQACSLGIILSGIIYFFMKFDSESNLILFTNEGLIHYRKKGSENYDYSEVNRINVIRYSKGKTTVYIKIKNKEMDFSLEKKNYSNFTYDEFFDYLLTLESGIILTEKLGSETYRYSKKEGKLIKTKVTY